MRYVLDNVAHDQDSQGATKGASTGSAFHMSNLSHSDNMMQISTVLIESYRILLKAMKMLLQRPLKLSASVEGSLVSATAPSATQ